jgi:HTH-type transcriptional regulator/antitoxin HipB
MTSSQPIAVHTAAQLSTHLKALRKLRGLTQAALGERIGVKQVRIADIEKNPGAVSAEQLLLVLHALDARMLIADTAWRAGDAALRAQEPGPSW